MESWSAVTEGGLALRVRPITPDDRESLAAGFERWSADSRYSRFLAPRSSLSSSELRYLTDVDQHDHVALVAFDEESDAPVAVARWIRLKDEPEVAEAAIAVGDDWQGRGIGTVMGHELARRALEEGVTTFAATALANNKPILEILGDLGAMEAGAPVGGVVELRIDLTGGNERGTPLRTALRGHAAGELAQPEPGST